MQRIIFFIFMVGFFSFFGLTVQLMAQTPPGQIGVSPALFEVDLGLQAIDKSIQLQNMKQRPVKVKVEVYNWSLDKNNNIVLQPPDSQSLDQWMIINPVAFTIAAGKTQTVRFSIRPRSQPSPGEHRAIIYFIEQPDPAHHSNASVEMLFRLGVGVYGYAAPVNKKTQVHAARLESQSKGSVEIVIDLENKGNVHSRVKGEFSIWEEGGFPGFAALGKVLETVRQGQSVAGFIGQGVLNNTPVLAGQRRSLRTGLAPLAANKKYVIALQGTVNDQPLEKTFSYSP